MIPILATLILGQQAQPAFLKHPNYLAMMEAAKDRSRLVRESRIEAWWSSETTGQTRFGGKLYTFSVDSAEVKETDEEVHAQPDPGNSDRWRTITQTPTWEVIEKGWNIYLKPEKGDLVPVTTDGSEAKRIRYGSTPWVYGEELEQEDAMGFSPDGQWLWYTRFDESKVPLTETIFRDGPRKEAYPFPGGPNPSVELFLYNVKTKATVKVKTQETLDGLGHYLCGMRWAPDSSELFFLRLNRAQNARQLLAVDPLSNRVRLVDEERFPTGWVEYSVNDESQGRLGDKWLIKSEANGSLNYYLLDPKTSRRTQVSKVFGDAVQVVKLTDKVLWFSATDKDHPLWHQLHRVNLDGTAQVQLTSSDFSHFCSVSPQGDFILDRAERSDSAPEVRLLDADGAVKQVVARTETERMEKAGFAPSEIISFPSMDRSLTLYGQLGKPRNFDPNKRYPVILDVYAGPLPWDWGVPREQWELSDGLAHMGALTLHVWGRGEQGRGRAFRQAIFRQLGQVEIDDQAAGIAYLRTLPYVDAGRVVIRGTSYGGYTTLMAMLRYPDLFTIGSAGSSVTDWRLYDSIYTERYMGLPNTNAKGYAAASAVSLAERLKGKLLLYYGTSDDNVHPSHSLQLIDALKRAGKPFQQEVTKFAGHSAPPYNVEMEFLFKHLFPSP